MPEVVNICIIIIIIIIITTSYYISNNCIHGARFTACTRELVTGITEVQLTAHISARGEANAANCMLIPIMKSFRMIATDKQLS